MSQNKITVSEWLSVLENYEPDEVPEGFLTREQIAKEIGKSGSVTREHLRRGINSGTIEKRVFRILFEGRKGLYPVPHYRIVKKAK